MFVLLSRKFCLYYILLLHNCVALRDLWEQTYSIDFDHKGLIWSKSKFLI